MPYYAKGKPLTSDRLQAILANPALAYQPLTSLGIPALPPPRRAKDNQQPLTSLSIPALPPPRRREDAELQPILANPGLVYQPNTSIGIEPFPPPRRSNNDEFQAILNRPCSVYQPKPSIGIEPFPPPRRANHSSDQDRSWETAGLTPGQMYDYMRNNENCRCLKCPVCIEALTYHERNKNRIRAWDHDVHADEYGLQALQNGWKHFEDVDYEDVDDKNQEWEPWTDMESFYEQLNRPLEIESYRLFDSRGKVIDDITPGLVWPRLIRIECDGFHRLPPGKTVIDYLKGRLSRLTDNAAAVEPVWGPPLHRKQTGAIATAKDGKSIDTTKSDAPYPGVIGHGRPSKQVLACRQLMQEGDEKEETKWKDDVKQDAVKSQQRKGKKNGEWEFSQLFGCYVRKDAAGRSEFKYPLR